MEYKTLPKNRRCIDCGKKISRKAKYRCMDCHCEKLRKQVDKRNPQYKDNPGKVGQHRAIIVRFGHAVKCHNINCKGRSRKFIWHMLKPRSGQRGGVFVQLCISCRNILSERRP